MINRDQRVEVCQWTAQLLTQRGWDHNNMRWDMQ